jgi:putative PIN family toxin of toxin-antitoxin system
LLVAGNGLDDALVIVMKQYQIVIDTNVFYAAMRSQKGASYKLLSLIDSGKFKVNLSIPLICEFEDVAKRNLGVLAISETELDDILDHICSVANRRKIFFLWRPFLKDPKDDFVMELAVEAQCDFIVTYNKKDFKDIEKFGIKAVTPKEFLQLIGEIL